MVQSQAVAQPFWVRWLLACLALLLGLAGGNAWAQAVPKDNNPPGFLLGEIHRPYLATLAVGSGGAPSVGMFNVLSVLHTGEKEDIWKIEPPFLSKNIQVQVGASMAALATLDANQPALSGLIALKLGDQLDFWTLINTDEVRKIPKVLLDRVEDNKPVPDLLEGNPLELDVYFQMALEAGRTADKAFDAEWQRRVDADEQVTYRHLIAEPRKQRGKVVRLEGRLRRIDRKDAPDMLRLQGIRYLYEAVFFVNNNAMAPVFGVFTELPPDLRVGERLNEQIDFTGYFYKKCSFTTGERRTAYAPILIGRMPHLLGKKAATEEDPNKGLLPLFLGMVLATIVAVLLLTFYFRYNDMKVRQTLALARNQDFVMPSPEDLEKNSDDQVTNGFPDTSDKQGSEPDQTPFPSGSLAPDRQRIDDL